MRITEKFTRRRTQGFMVAAAVVVATALGASIASAHGGDTSLIHSCVNQSSGTVKIVGATDSCKTNETALDWNQQGLSGPAGPAGPAGAAGPQGASGADSLYFRTSGQLVLGTGAQSVIVFCVNNDNEDGTADIPTGGGYEVHWNPPRLGPVPDVTVNVATTFYRPEFKSSGYSFAFDNNTGEDVLVAVTLTCAAR